MVEEPVAAVAVPGRVDDRREVARSVAPDALVLEATAAHPMMDEHDEPIGRVRPRADGGRVDLPASTVAAQEGVVGDPTGRKPTGAHDHVAPDHRTDG